jgi:hypothetical protein
MPPCGLEVEERAYIFLSPSSPCFDTVIFLEIVGMLFSSSFLEIGGYMSSFPTPSLMRGVAHNTAPVPSSDSHKLLSHFDSTAAGVSKKCVKRKENELNLILNEGVKLNDI